MKKFSEYKDKALINSGLIALYQHHGPVVRRGLGHTRIKVYADYSAFGEFARQYGIKTSAACMIRHASEGLHRKDFAAVVKDMGRGFSPDKPSVPDDISGGNVFFGFSLKFPVSV